MLEPWPTVDASAWTLAGVEQQGLHDHKWYRGPSERRLWLLKASRFEHVRGTPWQSLVELAGAAMRLCSDPTRQHWREMVLSVDRDSVFDVVSAAPLLADVTREFVVELVMVNRERLLDEFS